MKKIEFLLYRYKQWITKQTAYFMKQYIFVPAACIFSLSAAPQLSIQSGATLYLGGNAQIVLQDINLVNDGSITVAANGRFTFKGSANSSISGSQQPAFKELEIAKTGSNKLILQRAIDVNGKIVFTSGLIDLNNNNINLGNTAFLENENENSRVTGSNGGQLIYSTTLNAPALANPANLGAIISSSQNLGAVTIRRGQQSQGNGFGGGNSILRYYDIIPANNGSLNATLRFIYLDAELNGLTESSLALWRSPNNSSWSNLGFTTRDATLNWVEKNSIPELYRFTLSTPGNALPVHFILFNAQCRNGQTILTWKTAQETNSARFDIESSVDGLNWQVTGSLPASGNSTTEKTYSFIITAANDQFYRIAETGIDGRKTYSSILKSSCEKRDELTAWPNPVHDDLTVKITTATTSLSELRLYDTKGSLVIIKQMNILAGQNLVYINLNSYAAGIYSLHAIWGNGKTRNISIIKQ